MVGYYNYTVYLTYFSLLSGGIGIYFALAGNPLIAILCLGISGMLDLFDGKVARTKKDRNDEEKSYGIQIDSLSDLVCFGVLPVCIGYAVGMTSYFFIPLFALFILGGMIRLAYFNVLEIKREPEEKRVFYGVPITTAGFVFPFIFLFKILLEDKFYILYACILGLLMILFVLKIRIPKPKGKGLVILCILLGVIFVSLLLMEHFLWKK
ncbi:MAG: CDP-alcohol phosphatidyltransferase family protein [Anaeroplasmataceae bacterium]|jgi:Phosphatidylserine synthase|nr:CDP-alcohol phosphatidyltransferase family protein [Anaeroplasmataceae bacterium]